MKTFPDFITVFGKRIKIKVTSLDENHGEYETEPRVIKINDDPNSDWYEVLFHETLHASLEISGIREVLSPDKEEAVVRCIENAVWPLIQKGTFNAKQ